MLAVTRAVTIDAPIEQVWPWLAQMGGDRAGWYRWDAIDRSAGPSALSIIPDSQSVAEGDVMPAVPGARDAFVVATVDAPLDPVFTVPDGAGGQAAS